MLTFGHVFHLNDVTGMESGLLNAVNNIDQYTPRRRRRDATQLDTCVASASAVCIGLNSIAVCKIMTSKAGIASRLTASDSK